MESYDLAVIGAGPGGYVAAIRAAQLGMGVVLVEKRDTLGGTCLNVGCIPSKALLESSERYHAARNSFAEHGISVGDVTIDVAAMMGRKARIVAELAKGIGMLMKKNKIEVVQGRGVLAGAGMVRVEGDGEAREIRASNILLATGSAPTPLPFLPFDGTRVVSSTEALAFEAVPKHLVVVVAGAVGLELGSVWARLGAEVTVIEMLPTITPFADKMMAKLLERSLKKQGLSFRLSSKVTGAQVEDGAELAVTVEDGKGKADTLRCDKLLVAVGRRPYTEGIGLEEAGVKLEVDGSVAVDDRLRTSVPGVYAVGDLVPGPMLAHKAEEEGVAVAERIAGKAGHVNYDAIPSVVYTWPELAQVGMTEDDAKEKGLPVKTGRFAFKANGRAKCMGEEDGMVKVIAHAETDRVLGVHIVGPSASELIAEAVLAVEFQGSAEDVARSVHAHPTLAEVVKEAALAVDKRQIHG